MNNIFSNANNNFNDLNDIYILSARVLKCNNFNDLHLDH